MGKVECNVTYNINNVVPKFVSYSLVVSAFLLFFFCNNKLFFTKQLYILCVEFIFPYKVYFLCVEFIFPYKHYFFTRRVSEFSPEKATVLFPVVSSQRRVGEEIFTPFIVSLFSLKLDLESLKG